MGEVTEWFKVHAWKACVRLSPYRGFESRLLRHLILIAKDYYKSSEDIIDVKSARYGLIY